MMKRKLVLALAALGAVVAIGLTMFSEMYISSTVGSSVARQGASRKTDHSQNEDVAGFVGYTKEDVILKNKDYFNFEALAKNSSEIVQSSPVVEEFRQALEDIFAVPWQERKLEQLDSLFKKLLMSPDLTRQEKLRLLWEYAQTRDTDAEFQYIVETLAMLSPIELVDSIIASYESGINKDRKRVLLSVIDQALNVGEVEKYSKDQQDFIAKNIIRAQHFLKSSLYREDDPELLLEILSTFTAATGSEKEIEAVARDFLTGDVNPAIAPEHRRALLFRLSLENRTLQDLFLPQLLTAENRNDAQFYDLVSTLITEFGQSGYDNFTDQAKTAFLDFIAAQQVDLSQEKDLDPQQERIFINRLEALSALQADDTSQQPYQVLANHVLTTYVENQGGPLEISTVLILASDRSVVDILKERSPQIVSLLEQSLNDEDIVQSESKTELVKAGIEILKEP